MSFLKGFEACSGAPMMEFSPRCSKDGVQLSCAQHQQSFAFLFSRGEVALPPEDPEPHSSRVTCQLQGLCQFVV